MWRRWRGVSRCVHVRVRVLPALLSGGRFVWERLSSADLIDIIGLLSAEIRFPPRIVCPVPSSRFLQSLHPLIPPPPPLRKRYGLGALVCPLAATAFASSGIRFSYFYALSIGLSSVNAAVLLKAFRFNYRVVDHEDQEVEMEMEEVGSGKLEEVEREGERVVGLGGTEKKRRGKLEQTLRNKSMWICSLFIFV